MSYCPFSGEPCSEDCELFIDYNGEVGCVFRFLLGTTCLGKFEKKFEVLCKKCGNIFKVTMGDEV